MKKFLFLCLLVANVSYGQILTQGSLDGSILITPYGLHGKTNSFTDITNVALGPSAFRINTTGTYNTAIGYSSLRYSTTGYGNTSVGAEAMISNTIGGTNTAVGAHSLTLNTEGDSNTGTGYFALARNTTGSGNTAGGSSALTHNTSGISNTALGYVSLYENTTGFDNTAIGKGTMTANTVGYANSVVGKDAMAFNQSGYGNIAIGYKSGLTNITGSHNTFLGCEANSSGSDFINSVAIGAHAIVNTSNKIRFGNDQVTIIEGAVPFSTPSDRRLKQNIAPSLLGLSFIARLSPMSYTYIADKINVRHDGLIAQDVEKVMQELGVEFSGLQKSPEGTYSLAYSDFVMPLINAVKEQQKEIEELKERLSTLEELKAEIIKLRADAGLRSSDKK